MPNLNKVMLIGNLTRDPEVKYTPKGTAIAAFGIAVNRNYTTADGEKREEVTFIDLEAYARLAEIIGEYLKKGSSAFFEGRLKLDTWEDKETGKKRSKMKVIVETVQFLGGKRDNDGDYGNPAEGYQERPSGRSAPQRPTRPAPDPDLDAAPDDIPF